MVNSILISLLLTTRIFIAIKPYLPAYYNLIDQGIRDYKEGRDDDDMNPW